MYEPIALLEPDDIKRGFSVSLRNIGNTPLRLSITSNAYGYAGENDFGIPPGKTKRKSWRLTDSGNWYDFTVQSEEGYLHRFAGRVETGKHSISDPAMASEI